MVFLLTFVSLVGVQMLYYSSVVALLKQSLAAYNEGKPDDMIRCARKALARRPGKLLRVMTLQLLTLGYSNQGDLDEAEKYAQEAYDLALSLKNAEQTARSLVLLLDLLRKRGRIQEAIAGCLQAVQISPKAQRDVLICLSECYTLQARFEEARQTLRRIPDAPVLLPVEGASVPSAPVALKHAERRNQAVVALGFALIEAEAMQPDQALPYLEQAQRAFSDNPKLRLWCTTIEAWLLAQQGRMDESRQKAREAEASMENFGISTLASTLAGLGRMAFLWQDYAQSQRYWERYLDAKPDPVNLPRAYFHLGACHAQMADSRMAAYYYQQAIALGIDTYFARWAQQRLQDLAPLTT